MTPPPAGTERELLLAFLDSHRATLLAKVDGLDAAQLAATLPPSTMTLGGLLKHAAYNEDTWFAHRVGGHDPSEPWASVDWSADVDWDWHSAAADTPEELRELLLASIERSRAVVAGTDLDTPAVRPARGGEHPTLRWIVLHMIEELARHNGHADLLREAVDGATGE